MAFFFALSFLLQSGVFGQSGDAGDENGSESGQAVSCPVGAVSSPNCANCGEELEAFHHDEEEEWHYRDGVVYDGRLYHRNCLSSREKVGYTSHHSFLDLCLSALGVVFNVEVLIIRVLNRRNGLPRNKDTAKDRLQRNCASRASPNVALTGLVSPPMIISGQLLPQRDTI